VIVEPPLDGAVQQSLIIKLAQKTHSGLL